MHIDDAILQVIEKQSIDTQTALVNALAELEFRVTQPQLSRHLKKLGVRKVRGRYAVVGVQAAAKSQLDFVLSPPNMIVIKTLPGHANALAYNLEMNQFREVAGTVAGDDTVLVALRAGFELEATTRKLKKRLAGVVLH
ncbi:arginine repressor [Acanthopleuribacter pedis]|uniref:Arginine repressor n=1 Tax=Acanthopleuribacter pedis TaxID=442870 RepID=A0A8J7QBY1_9BACT|nr:hypothetical protein [Acanthopleuribacter pedis]MBO1323317.1 hypothetical protein [Acanthopleuribacter pedis]